MALPTATQTTTDFTSWEFYNKRVQQELTGSQFVSAESTLVAAGPPEMSDLSGGADSGGQVYPIGLLESAGIQQSKQLQRIFEIGSSRSYFIPGRVIGSINIGRTFYFGPSLLRVLYAYYRSASPVAIGTGSKGEQVTTNNGRVTAPNPDAALLDVVSDTGTLHQIQRSPGPDYFFIDLASDLFSQPTGLAIFFKDQSNNSLGGIYLEEAYVQGHQMNISSGSVLIMEGVSMQYDRIQGIQLMDNSTTAG